MNNGPVSLCHEYGAWLCRDPLGETAYSQPVSSSQQQKARHSGAPSTTGGVAPRRGRPCGCMWHCCGLPLLQRRGLPTVPAHNMLPHTRNVDRRCGNSSTGDSSRTFAEIWQHVNKGDFSEGASMSQHTSPSNASMQLHASKWYMQVAQCASNVGGCNSLGWQVRIGTYRYV